DCVTTRQRLSFPTRRSSDLRVSDSWPVAAVIVTYPAWRPVTDAVSPTPVTCAMAVLLLVHDTEGFETGLPLASPTAARRLIVPPDRKSTRLNSSHVAISYAV